MVVRGWNGKLKPSQEVRRRFLILESIFCCNSANIGKWRAGVSCKNGRVFWRNLKKNEELQMAISRLRLYSSSSYCYDIYLGKLC